MIVSISAWTIFWNNLWNWR